MSFNAVDTLFVSHLGDGNWDTVSEPGLGDKALAAMGYTFPVVMVITSISIGLGAGASSAIARAMGGGNTTRVRRLATDALTLATLIAFAVSVIGLFTIDWLFTSVLGASTELLPLIHDYMAIWYVSAPFLMVPMISLSALRALGFAKIQGGLMITGALINGVLDPFLIFGWAGLPRLELEGAAYATLASRVVTLIIAIYVLQGRMQVLTNPFVRWKEIASSWATLFHVGIPSMISNLIIPVSSGIVVNLVSKHGDLAVAGFSVAVRVEPIALIVFYALSGVVGPLCGQNKGAGLYHRVQETLSVVMRFCLSFGLLLGGLLWVVGPHIAGFFSDSEEVVGVVVGYLSIVPISYGAYGMVMSIIAMFNGMGHPLPGLGISFLRVMGVYLPFAIVFSWLWGLTGLFVATMLSNLMVGLIAYLWMRRVVSRQQAGTLSVCEES
ncbi:MATE family efflux transporter [Aurantivibrio plasticivorans]